MRFRSPAPGIELSRRRFLRGTGLALAMPFMASWPGRVAAAIGGAAPRRCAFLYFPNGAAMKDWVPAATGSDFALPYSL